MDFSDIAEIGLFKYGSPWLKLVKAVKNVDILYRRCLWYNKSHVVDSPWSVLLYDEQLPPVVNGLFMQWRSDGLSLSRGSSLCT